MLAIFLLLLLLLFERFRRFCVRAIKNSLSDLHEARRINSCLIVRWEASCCTHNIIDVTTYKQQFTCTRSESEWESKRKNKRESKRRDTHTRDMANICRGCFVLFSSAPYQGSTQKGKRRKMAWLMVWHFFHIYLSTTYSCHAFNVNWSCYHQRPS